jgi:hypothetical protein
MYAARAEQGPEGVYAVYKSAGMEGLPLGASNWLTADDRCVCYYAGCEAQHNTRAHNRGGHATQAANQTQGAGFISCMPLLSLLRSCVLGSMQMFV